MVYSPSNSGFVAFTNIAGSSIEKLYNELTAFTAASLILKTTLILLTVWAAKVQFTTLIFAAIQKEHRMKNLILSVIDFFYPLFKKFMPLQTFRYAACGGANTLLDIFLFSVFERNLKQYGIMHYRYFAITPHIAAMIAAFSITFPIGFYYSRYLVFSESNVRGRVQLIRYFSMVLACIALNYMFLKFFIEQLHIGAIQSKIITTVFVVTFSYVSQKHFTFQIKKIHHRTLS